MSKAGEQLESWPGEPEGRQDRGVAHLASPLAAEEVERVFVACEARLGRFLAQMMGSRTQAEDLLQDTFCEAFRLRQQLHEIRNPEAWLFGIARNRALAALRRRRRLGSALERLRQRPERSERDDLELLALRDLLQRHLSPDDRALLLLRYLHGFGADELAAMTGRTPEAVRQRLARARKRLISAADPHPATSTQERQL